MDSNFRQRIYLSITRPIWISGWDKVSTGCDEFNKERKSWVNISNEAVDLNEYESKNIMGWWPHFFIATGVRII